jgi:hypothetical protein
MLALALGLALVLTAATDGAPALAQYAEQTQSYVVQKGDTPNSIARKFYGKSNLGASLWRANRELVAHPRRLTPGDTLYIFPESTLALKKPIDVPPPPEAAPVRLYEEGQLLQQAFPKYFSFVADPRGQGGTGVTRIRMKRAKPVKIRVDANGIPMTPEEVAKAEEENREVMMEDSFEELDELYEVRNVGEIIGSADRGASLPNDGLSLSNAGRLLLSTGDNVVVRFTEDVAKIRDSDTHDDPDPYFTTFPIYSKSSFITQTDTQRPDYRQNVGQLFRYKGRLTVVARVEGLAPVSRSAAVKAQRKGLNQDLEPVSYIARITYSEDAVNLNDQVFLFVPADPGPERRLDSPYVETPDTYVSPGR